MSTEICEHGPVLTDTQAGLEAARCLMCDDPPCVAACPADVPVKHFIRAIRFEAPRRAINLIREQNVLAVLVSRLWAPPEVQLYQPAGPERFTRIGGGGALQLSWFWLPYMLRRAQGKSVLPLLVGALFTTGLGTLALRLSMGCDGCCC